MTKLQAYKQLLDENQQETNLEDIHNTRGKIEKKWESKNIYDPKYINLQKNDHLNNKLMERLNSEIDFMHQDNRNITIEKPFDDDFSDADEYAKYISPDKKQNKVIRKKSNKLHK